jgi:hypothetical protein
MKSDTPRFVPKLRLDNGTNKVFVPGKAELLKLIADTGLIEGNKKAPILPGAFLKLLLTIAFT